MLATALRLLLLCELACYSTLALRYFGASPLAALLFAVGGVLALRLALVTLVYALGLDLARAVGALALRGGDRRLGRRIRGVHRQLRRSGAVRALVDGRRPPAARYRSPAAVADPRLRLLARCLVVAAPTP